MTTTKNKGTSIKAITYNLMCEMQGNAEYVGWLNALRETTDKLVRAEGENKRLQTQATNATKGKDLAQTMLAAEMAKHKTTRDRLATTEGEFISFMKNFKALEDENERLRYEVEILRPIADDGMTNSFLMAQGEDKLANAEAEIKRLKHELHKAKESAESSLKGCVIALDENQSLRAQLTEVRTNTQNIPTNGSQDALDALKRIMQVDVSGRNAWAAHKEMQEIARKALQHE